MNYEPIICDTCRIPLLRDNNAAEYIVYCPECKNRCVLVTEGLNRSLIDNYRPIGTTLFSCLNCRQVFAYKPSICSQCGISMGFHESKLRLA